MHNDPSSVSSGSRSSRGLVVVAVGFALAALAMAPVVERNGASAPGARSPSGAYHALSFWGDSRAYPKLDIPPGAYTLGHAQAEGARRAALRAEGEGGESALGASSGWTPIGPINGGGRTLTLAFHPDDPDIVFAGAASGGLWRSETGGVGASAWTRIDTGFPVLGVSSIAFEAGDADVMYIGTGEVYNVEESGNLAADRRTRGSYGVGVLKSTDGGATWMKSLDWSYNQRHGVWAVRVDPADASIVWAATTDGVYKSTDAGLNWTKSLDVVMATDLVVHPTTPDTVLVACGNLSSAGRGIYRTTNGGATWAPVTGGGVPGDFAGKIQFGVTPADADVVYASVGNGFSPPPDTSDNFTWLLRSDDFGASFTLQNTLDYSRWQGWYAHDVAVHPSDPNTIICIGIDIWKSTNGGATLTQKTDFQLYFVGDLPPGGPEGPPTYSHADHHDVIYHPTDSDIFYVTNDGGVYRSLDGGETYAGVNGGYQTQQFYNGTFVSETDASLAMGGLQDNASTIFNGTGLWTRFLLGGDGGWCAIDPNDTDIVYATAQFLFAGKSLDGGASFFLISPPNLGGPVAFLAPFVMSPTNSSVLYAGSSFLFKSFNGGGQWFIGNGGAPIDGNPILLIAVAPQDDDVFYLATFPGTGRGRVHRSTDGGSTYTDITGALPDRFPGDLAVDPTDVGTVYLTLSGFGTSHVFKSIDFGATWIDIDGGLLPDVPTTAVAVDPMFPEHVYVGNDIGVFITRNGGSTWAQLAEGISGAVLIGDLNVSPADRSLVAFTHAQGAWKHDLLGPPCAADLDGDGAVGPADLALLLGAWGDAGVAADLDGGGAVGAEDLAQLLGAWGACP